MDKILLLVFFSKSPQMILVYIQVQEPVAGITIGLAFPCLYIERDNFLFLFNFSPLQIGIK